MKITQILFSVFLLLCICTSSVVERVEASARKVRIGYFILSGYQEIDENGNRTGYGYDLLQKLRLYNDWEYEYVAVGSYSEALKALEEGKVDIVTSVTKSAERMQKYAYSRKPLGTSSTIITTNSSNSKFTAGDIDSYNGMVVGMVPSNSRNDSLKKFADLQGFSYKSVYLKNTTELEQALKDGKIDAAVTSNLRELNEEHVLEVFDARDFYLVTRIDDYNLMNEANSAIDKVYAQEPNWIHKLWLTHYSIALDKNVTLAKSEQSYLEEVRKENKVFKILINPKQKPYGYLENGKIIGVYSDLVDRLAKRLNIKYEIIPVKDNFEYNEAVKNGIADVIVGTSHDHSKAENLGYVITEPFYDMGMALLTKKSQEGEIKTVARNVNSEDRLKPYLEELGAKDIKFVNFDTYEECIFAVGEGKCDAAITNRESCRIFILKYPHWNLTYEPLRTVQTPCVAVNSKLDRRCVSIINKYVDALDETDIVKLSHKYITKDVATRSIYAHIYENSLLSIVAILVALVGLASMWYTVNNSKQLKVIEEKNKELEASRQTIKEALEHAEHANRAKTNFLNNMSHDIRTPMNAIIGFTSLASTHIDKTDLVKRYLQKIMVSSNHLLSLINDVLDMSRIESGTVTIKEVECSLPTIMHDLRSILQSDIKAKNFNFFIDTVDVEHENIYCDKLKLNQVLLNLLGNAMKFTPVGGTVGVKVIEEHGAPEDFVDFKFIVTDTGIGMNKEFLEHIFEPFVREENSTVSGIQGSGLGLAITKNIINMMGGTITVKSEKNKGSEFTISLRLRTSANQKHIEIIKKLDGMRALVADDSADSCVGVARMLKSIGMRSEWTTLGKEAVLRAKVAQEDGDNFKVYIIDWLMPDMNGIEVVRRIRQVIGDDIPIIIITAYDWSDIEEEAMDAGVTAFCAKPIFLSELYDILYDLTSDKKDEQHALAQEQNNDNACFEGKRVLLVEDVEMNREIAMAIMEDEGILVDAAENGQLGLEKLKNAAPGYYDIVCMDIMMPVMDGYTATKAIRELDDPKKANIPVIAMTANAFEEDKEKARECGMDDFLTKPFQIEQLFKLMKKHLN